MAGMNACLHPDELQVRTVYYLLCGACKAIRLVTYCNYPVDCHAKCALAAVCVQPAREKYHAQVPLAVEPGLLEAARAAVEAR
jgi:hypothetical protein